MEFSKVPVQNIENIWKYYLKWTRCLISIFIVSFDLYEYVFATSLGKRKTNIPHLYSGSSLFCHYGITIFCCITKTFCPETLKFLRDGFYWNPCWNRCEHRDDRVSESKCEPLYWGISHHSRVFPEQRWKVLSISLKLWANGGRSKEQCVIMSNVFPNCHRSDTRKF